MEFLANYGLFLLKSATIVASVLLIIIVIFSLAGKSKSVAKKKLKIKKLNRRLDRTKKSLNDYILSKPEVKKYHKALRNEKKEKLKKQKKAALKSEKSETKGKVFALRFNGDIKASAVESLREEITAILLIATPNDEVVIRLESGGGMVPHYGLAASQLVRVREAGIPLTVCIDKIAASGGYLMSCVANNVLAAPFAIIGSIGVIGQVPNIRRLVNKHGVDVEQHTAGKYKRTLTLLGENTDEAREKFKEDLEQTHLLFKDFVRDYRPELDMDTVATGEYWYGSKAISLGLVDKLTTSDDYLISKVNDGSSVYEMHISHRKGFAEKLAGMASIAYDNILNLAYRHQRGDIF